MATEKKNPEEEKDLPVEKKEVKEPAKTVKKAAAKKPAAKKPAAKKTTAKKATVKKPAAKKVTSKQASAADAPAEKKALVEVAIEEPKAEKTDKKEPEMKQRSAQPSGFDRGALILGGGMLLMGVILLLGRLVGISFSLYLWPFIFIVPGVLVFMTALSTESSSGEGLSILGGILTMLGFLFLAQSATGMWASWAYAWALVAPTSVGISQMVYGMRKDRDTIVQSGRKLANLGMVMFVIGFVFFELILGISGFGLARFGLPVFPMMLIFAGLIVLVSTLMRRK
jgi:cation transport ATPase